VRVELNQRLAGVVNTQTQYVLKCVLQFAKDFLIVDSPEVCIEADNYGKVAAAVAKTHTGFDRKMRHHADPGTAISGRHQPRRAGRAYELAHDLYGAALDDGLAFLGQDRPKAHCQRSILKRAYACHESGGSTRSTSNGSAQWRSSLTNTTGLVVATRLRNRGTTEKASSARLVSQRAARDAVGDAVAFGKACEDGSKCLIGPLGPIGPVGPIAAGQTFSAPPRRAAQRSPAFGVALRAEWVHRLAVALHDLGDQPRLGRAVERDDAVGRHRFHAAFECERAEGLKRHRGSNQPLRGFADEHLTVGGFLLQTRGDVHRIATTSVWSGTDDDLAGVDGDAQSDVADGGAVFARERAEGLLHADAGTHGAKGRRLSTELESRWSLRAALYACRRKPSAHTRRNT